MQEGMGVNMCAYNEQHVRYMHTRHSPDITKNDRMPLPCEPGEMALQCSDISKGHCPYVIPRNMILQGALRDAVPQRHVKSH
jgi:hypothetical protein